MEKQPSLAKNSIYYMFYQISNLIFPFISGIYIAHTLFPSTIGKVTQAQNFVTYFVTFSFLGIPTYGIREVAKARNNKRCLDKLFSELFTINFFSTCIFSLIYFFLVNNFEAFKDNAILYNAVGISLLLNSINISWLFEGLEQFTYITKRNVIFKIISFFILIILVKNDDDFLLYALLNSIGTAGNYFINVFYSKKFVKLDLSGINIKQHLKAVLLLAAINAAIEIYTIVDITMLGFISTYENVTFYSYANKIYKIFLQIINTFTIVVVPRLALYYQEERNTDFNLLLYNTLRTILIISVPMIFGIVALSDQAIVFLYGETYIQTSFILKILSINILLSPVGYLLGSRVLLVTNNENKTVYCVAIGAIINIISNFILIPFANGEGAAIASVISEVSVLIGYLFYSKKHYSIKSIKIPAIKVIIASLFMYFIIMVLGNIIVLEPIKMLIQFVVGVISYFTVLFIIDKETTKDLFDLFSNIFKFRKK